MTGIICRRLDQDNFSLWKFYVERGQRILPALCVMCSVLLVAGWYFLFPSDYKALGKYTASAVTFLSNFAFFKDTGYFDTVPTEKWLLHTWSLSVEWQFYLLYPLVLMGLRRWTEEKPVKHWLAALGLASFIISFVLSGQSPAAAFYLLPARAWEMIVGGIVFLYPVAYSQVGRTVAEWLGLAAIAFACVWFVPTDVWPGTLAAVPVIGTALVLSGARSNSLFLGHPLMQFIGRCSYSIYLWHWPVVVGLHYSGKMHESKWVVAAILASVFCGWLSTKYVENMLRRTKGVEGQGAPARIVPMAAMAIVTAVFGLSIFFLQGMPHEVREVNHGERSKFIESYAQMHKSGLAQAYRAECDFYDWSQKSAKAALHPSCTGVSTSNSVFIWGDSHAQALSVGIRNLLSQSTEVAQVATSGCSPIIGAQRTPSTIDNNCDVSNTFALAEIARLRPKTVIMAQRRNHDETDWGVLADRLHELGIKNVILVGPLPSWLPSLPSVVARGHWYDPSPYVSGGLDKTSWGMDQMLSKRWGESKRLNYISMIEKLCTREACIGFAPGEPRVLMAVDYAHLTIPGSNHAVYLALKEKLGAWHALR